MKSCHLGCASRVAALFLMPTGGSAGSFLHRVRLNNLIAVCLVGSLQADRMCVLQSWAGSGTSQANLAVSARSSGSASEEWSSSEDDSFCLFASSLSVSDSFCAFAPSASSSSDSLLLPVPSPSGWASLGMMPFSSILLTNAFFVPDMVRLARLR